MHMAVLIGEKTLPLPILQGGMGVGVSLDRLAGAVAACGGMGTISTALCGYLEPDFDKDPDGANLRALDRQVRRAKVIAGGNGLVAVNAMVATRQYADSVRTALRAGADAIVCGAGLPKDLPAIAAEIPEHNAALAPVISSGRAAALICKLWERSAGRIPDFVVLEGPLAGGHLGFTPEDAKNAETGTGNPLHSLLNEVISALAPFREKYGRDIPIFLAGGIQNGHELAHYMKLGAAGGQFATRFITTKECDASLRYKQTLVRAKPEDIAIVKSPVGMPGRALRTPIIDRVENGTQPAPSSCIRCLTACNPATAPYCISRALMAAAQGDWENGLFFCGANAGELDTITTVQEEMDQIMREWMDSQ